MLSFKSPHLETFHFSVPINFLNFYKPNLFLDSWKIKGVWLLDNLYDGIKSFSCLREIYNLRNSDYFKYIKIHHVLHNPKSKQCYIPSVVVVFLKIPSPQAPKGTKIYDKIFTKNVTFFKTTNLLNWE